VPIKPENRGRYPADWKEIRKEILARAEYCCEGSPAFPRCRAPHGQFHPDTGSRVVLTIAHLDQNPENNDRGNLRALCQRCHLRHDADFRRNAAKPAPPLEEVQMILKREGGVAAAHEPGHSFTWDGQEVITFFVQGEPATQGSKKAFHRKGMRFPVIVDDCARNKPWRADVRAAAALAIAGRPPILGPVAVTISFYLRRPNGHHVAGDPERPVKASAPQFPVTKPDVIKLARAVEDSLKELAWKDDSQVVHELLTKWYARPGEPVGARVQVRKMKGEDE
jgi:Holliday junction resolvase RusA-like endonuclease